MNNYLENLNEEQRKPVLHTEGPLMVIAGAGSGKTRVLTYKIIHLLKKGVSPFNILALTFTNKAAKEMKQRISNLTNDNQAKSIWMGTFHSVFARILRSESELIGFPPNFTIYDSYDSEKLISNIIKEMNLNKDFYKAKGIKSRVSSLKNSFITPKNYFNQPELIESDKLANRIQFGEIYRNYVDRCFKSAVMDFDDLLLKTNQLLNSSPETLIKYQKIFKYILVDEYQDTNYSQYLIIKSLADRYQNLCVVGDDSQSIYSFRGANIDNILNFKKNYPECTTYKLEQNYRSSKNIVEGANSLIKKNKYKIDKNIWTLNDSGSKIILNRSQNDSDEGRFVASNIFEEKNNNQLNNGSFAVLYRTNAQSRSIEDALRKANIDYQVFGGLSFYQRKEIKDVTAYLRLVVNSNDEESFRRIVNFPPRGIGLKTLEKLLIISERENISMYDAINIIDKYPKLFNKGVMGRITDFRNLIESLKIESKTKNADYVLTNVINGSGIIDFYRNEGSVESINRIENIEELRSGINDFILEQKELADGDTSITRYLQDISLYSETDKSFSSDRVSLMTIHMAKGLEFNVVYVVGIEENLFPSILSLNSSEDLEEERRLFYVAMTRAKDKLILSHCDFRFKWGNIIECEPSRFIEEVDLAYIEKNNFKEEFKPTIDNNISRIRKLRKRGFVNVNKVDNNNSPIINIVVNDVVEHQRFGLGLVEKIEGDIQNKKATINFKIGGRKTILLKFAKLKIKKGT
ncbi:UvrD-helicase domain-containing protein [Flavobacteriales bacterium]|nr:UvrD-helicase domain-containing protein [Flavobacteriales bacterium]